MKKVLIICLGILLIISLSCNNSSSEEISEFNSESAEKFPKGKKIYESTCLACHQTDGKGIASVFPPLAKSDYLLSDKKRAIRQVINGSSEEMVVNGETYNAAMPPQGLSDKEVVEVMNYILNSWGNEGGEITIKDVQNVQK
jgi:nitrite reductase (NO-forming)